MNQTRPESLDELAEPVEPGDHDWNEVGVVHWPGLIPDELIERYNVEWLASNGYGPSADARWMLTDATPGGAAVLDVPRPGGWPDCTPYMRHEALRELCTYGPLAQRLAELFLGEPAGVHLNLSGWVTTGRRWHQDTYLNPPEVGDFYAAVWIALGDIHPDSGPFQYIPGSHMWHRLLREKIAPHVDMADPQWPKHTEDFLTPLVEQELEVRRGCWGCEGWGRLDRTGRPSRDVATYSHDCAICDGSGRDPDAPEIVSYLPKRGDVLAWHGRLYHQGSQAHVLGAYRPALIAHYSGIRHRPDMPKAVQTEHGGWYFPIDGGPV